MENLLAIIQEPSNSEKYLKYVLEFAKDFNSKVKLLYVCPSEKYSHSADLISAQSIDINLNIFEDKEKSKELIENIVNKLKSEIKIETEISVVVENGKEISTYNEITKIIDFDLVIFNSNNEGGTKNSHSSTLEIFRKLNCPLLIVPNNYEYKSLNKIVYATDYKDSDIKTIKELLCQTKSFEPEIITLHITDSTDLHERAMKYGFKDVLIHDTGYQKIDIKVFKEEKGKDIGEYINEISTRMKADILVLLKENHNFFDRIFKFSAAESIVQEVNIPIWVFINK